MRAGDTPEELSREFALSAQSIRNWAHKADLDEGHHSDGLISDEREHGPAGLAE
ncbi:MAG: hypothetical protein ACE5IM_13370 [Nitrospinota bacterium]